MNTTEYFRDGARPAPVVSHAPIGAAWQPPPDDAEFADTLRKLWRRKWLIAGCVVTVLALATGAAMLLPQLYTATAMIRIGLPTARVAQFDSVVSSLAVNSAVVQSELHVLRSRELVGRVADRLQLKSVPEFNPALREPTFLQRIDPRRLIRRLMASRRPQAGASSTSDGAGAAEDREREWVISGLLSNSRAAQLGRSHVLELSVDSTDPVLAARIAAAWAESYVEDQLVQKVTVTEKANKWLVRQLHDLRAQVEEDERAVAEYRRRNGLFETRSESVTSQQLSELNTQMILARAESAEKNARLRQAQAQLKSANAGDSTPEVLSSPLIQALKQQQATVERRVAELSVRYGKKHPTMRDARAELKDIQSKIRAEIGKIVGGLRNEAETASARYQALRSNLESIKKDVARDNEHTIALRTLEREAAASRALFEQFLQRSKETDAQREIQQAGAHMVSPVSTPQSPSSPPVNLMIAIALIGGTTIGVVLALLRESLDRTVRTEDELETVTGLPTLTVVPRIGSRHRVGDYRSGQRASRNSDSPFYEAVRRLDLNLGLAGRSGAIMITSTSPKEGKSSISLSLARVAAAGGRSVILVDCDWRNPRLHRLLRRPVRRGLGELLTGRAVPDDVVYRDASGAHVVFAGSLGPGRMNLLCGDAMRYLVDTLVRHYDVVLIDTPPTLVAAEVLHLARIVDTVVYVVRWGRTSIDAASKGLHQLGSAGAPLAGTVLSRVDPKRYRKYADVRYAVGRFRRVVAAGS